MVHHQVVVVAGARSTPIATVSVGTFHMAGVAQALCDQAPLKGHVFHSVNGTAFVDTPTDRAMVHHDVLLVHAAQTIAFVVGYMEVPKPEADEADDDIAGVDGEGIIGDANAVTGAV